MGEISKLLSLPRVFSYLVPIAAALGVPYLMPTYYVSLLADAFALALVAMGVNLMLAYAELPSFGHAAFYGVAAYVVAMAFMWLKMPVWACFVLAVIVSLGLGLAIGSFSIKRRGIYFAIITLVSGEVIHRIFWYTRAVGGSDGMSFPRWFELRPGYYFVLALVLVACLLFLVIGSSPFGKALRAIGENEVRARFVGYNVELYKRIAFVLSSIFPALGGAFIAGYRGFVNPYLASVHISSEAVIATLIGGSGTLIGPILGSIFLVFLMDIVSSYWVGYLTIIGMAIVLVILFMPQGTIPLTRALVSPRLRKSKVKL